MNRVSSAEITDCLGDADVKYLQTICYLCLISMLTEFRSANPTV